jgi:UDP-N-acetylglucosamine 2-epimerase (non-hydrolysing)
MKIILVAGARPNFMKVAPLIRAFERHNSEPNKPRIECLLVHTGQHYDARMSSIFFEELGLKKPDINLAVGSGSHAEQTANIMLKFEPICVEQQPDWVIVVGDVNSTLGCALVAAKLQIKVAHLEAGLRSFDRSMPEEINRIVTDSISALLLTPSPDADMNLLKEGVPASNIARVGNIMIDAIVTALNANKVGCILKELRLSTEWFAYVTAHRPANVDNPKRLNALLEALQWLATLMPVVFPIHPRTRHMLDGLSNPLPKHPQLFMVDPVGYLDSLELTKNARLVLTDSGGLQEEATYFRTPCLTLRPNTERPITILQGSNALTSFENLKDDLQTLLSKPTRLGSVPELWDGNTSSRVLNSILNHSR